MRIVLLVANRMSEAQVLTNELDESESLKQTILRTISSKWR